MLNTFFAFRPLKSDKNLIPVACTGRGRIGAEPSPPSDQENYTIIYGLYGM